MRETITISIPEEIKQELDALSKKEGVSRSDVVRESLRDFFFFRTFHRLRNKMRAKAAAQGIITDEDVFKTVS
jgi:metal-responsive CopG/Arc/MetJ family transcriptional regulator